MKIHLLCLGGFSKGFRINTIWKPHPDKIPALWHLEHCLLRQVNAQLIAENFYPFAVDLFEALDIGF